jgi:hypothetical protein
MRGSKGWLRRRRAAGERYVRIYGYVTEERLRRWRQLRRHRNKQLEEALREAPGAKLEGDSE